MGRKRYTVESIVRMLREAEVELAGGLTVSQAVPGVDINQSVQKHHRIVTVRIP